MKQNTSERPEGPQHDVDMALDIAVFENGYTDLMSQTSREIADNMIEFDVTFEDTEAETLVPLVQAYLDWYHDPNRT